MTNNTAHGRFVGAVVSLACMYLQRLCDFPALFVSCISVELPRTALHDTGYLYRVIRGSVHSA